MTAREWLEKQTPNTQVTFVIAEAHKEKSSPFYCYLYRNTPIRSAWEWLQWPDFGKKDLVINADHPPIDIPGHWGRMYNGGNLKCAMIVDFDDMRKVYTGEEQYKRMVAYYNENIK